MDENDIQIKLVEVKKMNETKKIILILVAIVAVIGLVVGVSIYSSKQSEEKLNDILEEINSDETHLFFLGRPTCSYCVEFTPVIEQLSEDYDFDYEYINIDELSSSGLSELLQALNIDESNFGTPYLSITNNGDVTAEQSGALDREALFNFLQESGMVAGDVEYKSEYPNLTMIDYARYTEILESGEKSIVVIGQTGCMYCEETKPVLNEIAEEYDITINYLNITDLSEEDSSNLMNSVTYLKELESFGTPLTMVIENQEVVGHQDGYVEKSVFEEFFREQGFIE